MNVKIRMKNDLDESNLSELGIETESDWEDSHWADCILNPKDVSYAYRSMENPESYFCFMSCGESILINKESYNELKDLI